MAVTPDMVEAKQVDPGSVVGTPFGDPSELQGREAVVEVPAGGQVNQETVGAVTDQVCVSCALLPGEKAIAFQVDPVTGLDFLIQPGDHIDIVFRSGHHGPPADRRLGLAPANPRYEPVTGLEAAPRSRRCCRTSASCT